MNSYVFFVAFFLILSIMENKCSPLNPNNAGSKDDDNLNAKLTNSPVVTVPFPKTKAVGDAIKQLSNPTTNVGVTNGADVNGQSEDLEGAHTFIVGLGFPAYGGGFYGGLGYGYPGFGPGFAYGR